MTDMHITDEQVEQAMKAARIAYRELSEGGWSNAVRAAAPFLQAQPESLHFECPADGLKWQFHTQEQLNMIQKHFEVHGVQAQPEPVDGGTVKAIITEIDSAKYWVASALPYCHHSNAAHAVGVIDVRLDRIRNWLITGPQPVDGELLEAASKAFMSATGFWGVTDKRYDAGIIAVLRVAADALLADLTPEEGKNFTVSEQLDVDLVFAKRRARLTAKKTAEERVIVDCDAVDQWYVMLDKMQIMITFPTKGHAKRYAEGLIAELRESEGK